MVNKVELYKRIISVGPTGCTERSTASDQSPRGISQIYDASKIQTNLGCRTQFVLEGCSKTESLEIIEKRLIRSTLQKNTVKPRFWKVSELEQFGF